MSLLANAIRAIRGWRLWPDITARTLAILISAPLVAGLAVFGAPVLGLCKDGSPAGIPLGKVTPGVADQTPAVVHSGNTSMAIQQRVRGRAVLYRVSIQSVDSQSLFLEVSGVADIASSPMIVERSDPIFVPAQRIRNDAVLYSFGTERQRTVNVSFSLSIPPALAGVRNLRFLLSDERGVLTDQPDTAYLPQFTSTDPDVGIALFHWTPSTDLRAGSVVRLYMVIANTSGRDQVDDSIVWNNYEIGFQLLPGTSKYIGRSGTEGSLGDAWYGAGASFGKLRAGGFVVVTYAVQILAHVPTDQTVFFVTSAKSGNTPIQEQAYVHVVRPTIDLHATLSPYEDLTEVVVTVTNSSTANLQNLVVFADHLSGVELVAGSTSAHFLADSSDRKLDIADSWLRDSVNLGNLPPNAAVELRFRTKRTGLNVQEPSPSVIWAKSDEIDWIYAIPAELALPSGSPVSVS